MQAGGQQQAPTAKFGDGGASCSQRTGGIPCAKVASSHAGVDSERVGQWCSAAGRMAGDSPLQGVDSRHGCWCSHAVRKITSFYVIQFKNLTPPPPKHLQKNLTPCFSRGSGKEIKKIENDRNGIDLTQVVAEIHCWHKLAGRCMRSKVDRIWNQMQREQLKISTGVR